MAQAEPIAPGSPPSPRTDAYGRPYRLPVLRAEAEQWVLARIPSSGADQRKSDQPPIDDASLIRILKEIEREFSGDARRFRHNAVVDFVELNNRLHGWGLHAPNKIVRMPLPRPPITGATFPSIARFRRLRTAFEQFFVSKVGNGKDSHFADIETNDATRNRLIGRILLSAVIHGGVLTIETLAQLAAHEIQGEFRWGKSEAQGEPCRAEFLTWIEWPAPKAGGCRRWIADPVTALLLLRWRQLIPEPLLPKSSESRVLWKLLRVAIDELSLPDADKPGSITKLLSWARCWYYIEIPPFLVAYATNTLPSASLPVGPWVRLLTGRAVVVAPDSANGEAPEERRRGSTILQTELRKALSGPTGKQPGFKEAQVNLDQFLERGDLTALATHLARWCKALLRAKSATSGERRANSVRRYLESIDSRLASFLGTADPAILNSDARAASYEAMLDAATSDHTRVRIAYALHLFEQYLHPKGSLSAELLKMVEDVDNVGRVDANFFSTDFINATRTAVSAAQNPHDPDDSALRELAVILGSRGKLRRIEAWRLRMGDIVGQEQPELLVRPRPSEKLKSASSTRRAVLFATCTDEELHFLRICFSKRARAFDDAVRGSATETELEYGVATGISMNEIALLARDPLGETAIPEQTLFDGISHAMRAATGDETARIQHLRHSGLNRDLVLLLRQTLPGCSRILGDDEAEIAKAAEVLHGTLLGRTVASRRALWAVAGEAGHASPTTTCGSYLHLLDWLLYCAASERAPNVSAEVVATIFPFRPAALRKAKERTAQRDTRWPDVIARMDKGLCDALRPDFVYASLNRVTPVQQSNQGTAIATGAPLPTGSASRLIDALVGATRLSEPQMSLLRVLGKEASAVEAVLRKFPPASSEVAEQMVQHIRGLDASMRSELVSGLANPQVSINAARQGQIDITVSDLVRARSNARNLNCIAGASTNRDRRNQMAQYGIPVLNSAQSGDLLIRRPLPHPRTAIRYAIERKHTDLIFRAAYALWHVDRTRTEKAVTVMLDHYDTENHRLSLSRPADAGVVVAFLKDLLETAGVRDLPSTLEHVPHVPRWGQAARSPDEQSAAWSSALGVATRSIPQSVGRPLERRGSTFGLLRVEFRLEASGSKTSIARRVKVKSEAIYHALYTFSLFQDFIFL